MGQLLHDYADAVKVGLRLLLLRPGPVDVSVEARYAGYAVDDAAALQVPHLDDARDVPLLHQVVAVRGYPGLGQEAVELRHRGLAVIDVEIRTVVGTVVRYLDMTGETHLVIVPGHHAVPVVEHEGDLREPGLAPGLAPIEDQVGELPCADRLGALRTQDEQDGIRDVGLPGTVRPRHGSVPIHQRHC